MFAFWWERKTDKISVKKLVGPIFNHGHHSIRLYLVVIAVLSVSSRKHCGAKSGLVGLVTTLPKLYVPTFCTHKYSTLPSQLLVVRARKNKNNITKNIQSTMVFDKTIAGEGASPSPPA
jgi:hypothetical protein